MKALLKFCCFSPPQTVDSEGSLHFKRLDGGNTVGSKNSYKVLGLTLLEPRTREIHLLFVEPGAACRLPSTHHVQEDHGGAGKANKPVFRVTGDCLRLPAQQNILALCCPNLRVGLFIFNMCRFMQHANTSKKQHSHAAGDDCNVSSTLLQNQSPASNAQVTFPQSISVHKNRPSLFTLGSVASQSTPDSMMLLDVL